MSRTTLDDAPRQALLAALAWQLEAGVDEAICETPQDRFAEGARAKAEAEARRAAARAAAAAPTPVKRAAPPPPAAPEADAETEARSAAAAADDLPALEAAVRGFERCALRATARQAVFADGNPAARVMVVGEAPGRDEDREGKPFVGRAGRLLDRMMAAIGLDRRAEAPDAAVYVTNLVYWRPVENRTPSDDEAAMLLPFLERHIELARPDVVLLAGGSPAKALLRTTVGITRMRGKWRRWNDVPCLPVFHPAYLLRNGEKKREAWRDLLALRAMLDGETPRFED